jgi:hypothetical protein
MAKSTQQPYKLTPEDKTAFIQTSKQLGLDPYEFGGLIQLESGFRPNVWGGAGGQYRGLIQFGPGARKEVGLPSKEMTIAEQLPYVKKYFDQRGYKPGMGIEKAYATVLVGNPGGSLSAKDSFGTSVGAAAPRMKPGGDLYKAAKSTLGDLGTLPQASYPQGNTTGQTKPTEAPKQVLSQQQLPGQPININLIMPVQQAAKEKGKNFLDYYLQDTLSTPLTASRSKIDPIALLTRAASGSTNYFG